MKLFCSVQKSQYSVGARSGENGVWCKTNQPDSNNILALLSLSSLESNISPIDEWPVIFIQAFMDWLKMLEL